MVLIYTDGTHPTADVVILPDTFRLSPGLPDTFRLSPGLIRVITQSRAGLIRTILDNVFNLILNVQLATSNPSFPRVLLNAAWSFEADRFSKWPEVAIVDTQSVGRRVDG